MADRDIDIELAIGNLRSDAELGPTEQNKVIDHLKYYFAIAELVNTWKDGGSGWAWNAERQCLGLLTDDNQLMMVNPPIAPTPKLPFTAADECLNCGKNRSEHSALSVLNDERWCPTEGMYADGSRFSKTRYFRPPP